VQNSSGTLKQTSRKLYDFFGGFRDYEIGLRISGQLISEIFKFKHVKRALYMNAHKLLVFKASMQDRKEKENSKHAKMPDTYFEQFSLKTAKQGPKTLTWLI
jgi:hypothetical protein